MAFPLRPARLRRTLAAAIAVTSSVVLLTGCAKTDAGTTADGKTVRHPVKENDVSWRAGGVTHSIKNVGHTRFEALDIELK